MSRTEILRTKLKMLKHRIGLKTYFLLFRAQLFFERATFKKALSLKNTSLTLIDAEIRSLDQGLLQLGESNVTDGIIESVARHLTNRAPHPEISDIEAAHVEKISTLKAKARLNQSAAVALKTYFLAAAYVESKLKKTGPSANFLEAAKQLDAMAVAYSDKEIYSAFKRTQVRLRLLRAELAERSAIKLDFRLSDITAMVAIVSATFVVAGYLHTKYFFAVFGIDSTLFFTVGDYLSASLERIHQGAFAAILGLCSMFWGLRDESLKPLQLLKAKEGQKKRMRWLLNSLTLALILTGLWTISIGEPNFGILYIAATLTSMVLATRLGPALFQRPLLAIVSLATLFIFAFNVAISGYKHVTELRTTSKSRWTLQLKFKDPSLVEHGELNVIGINSQYVFLLAGDKHKVLVLPRDKIDMATSEEALRK